MRLPISRIIPNDILPFFLVQPINTTFICLFVLLSLSCSDDALSNRKKSPFFPSIISVSHRGFTRDGAVENTAEAYKHAKMAGFQYGETDVQWTKDDVPVCCHLDFFQDNSTKNTIHIKDYTLEELRRFNYMGTTISTLEEVMDTCKKYSLGLYLDRFTSFNAKRKQIIYDLIERFGKENVCYLFGSMEDVGIRQALEFDSCATIGILSFKTINMPLVEFANKISTPENRIILDLDFSNNPVDTLKKYRPLLNANVEYGIFTINNKKSYKKYLPFASSITSDFYSEKMIWDDAY